MSVRLIFTWSIVALLAVTSISWVANNKNNHYGLVEEHDLPQTLAQGASCHVTWSLDIHNTAGFARFQIQFPDGIEIVPLESEGASFTFQDGKAKFIWMELPPQRTLELHLTVSANENFQGGVITQWFSFIEDGSRKDVEFEPHPLALEASAPPAGENLATNAPITSDKPPQRSVQTSAVVARRTWSSTKATSGTMEIEITGFESGQFLKISETLGDLVAIPLDDGVAHIRDQFDGQLVYIWHTAPEVPKLKVTYEVAASSPQSIQGTVSTIVNGEALELLIPPAEIIAPPSDPSSDLPPSEPSLADIAFRVQVLATHQHLSGMQVQRAYAYPGEIRREQHEGWNKYTTGYFTAYRAARDKRVELRKDHLFPGPFVTAYSGKRRITVQEALLISQQNWIR